MLFLCQLLGHLILFTSLTVVVCTTNLPPSFTQDINNLAISELTPVGKVIFTLEGTDPENSSIHFGLNGTNLLKVDSDSGEVFVVQALDYETNSTLNIIVTIEDEVENAPVRGNNIVEVPVTIIILDENDNPPVFSNAPYTVFIPEDTPIDSTVFSSIIITDADTVGNAIEVTCDNLPNFKNACDGFSVTSLISAQNRYEGALILTQSLNFALQNEYQFILRATDGELNSTTTVIVKVEDIQNTAPIFTSPLYAEVIENSSINTVVLKLHAEDGDQGDPRTIVYELIENPMNYFLLDANTGMLITAKPLDREALKNPLGILQVKVKAVELVDGFKTNDPLTSTIAEVTVVIKDTNDEPPSFNKNDYYVEVAEDAPSEYALPNLDMVVGDPDTGNNSVFELTLNDILHVFSIEPKQVLGSSSVTIRVSNNTLDYEDPNQRKFIILVLAKEIYTDPQLSSTATVTVTVTDANDNAPTFDRFLYSATVSETAQSASIVTIITAKDRDSGSFGENGIVYQLVGDGSEHFEVDSRTGTITVADCISPGHLSCLDYETKQEYLLTYKATDDNGKGQTTSVPFKIAISDSNDNPPIFHQPFYNVFINEGATKFEPDLIVKAEDLDKTSQLTYSITVGNENNMFDVDSKTGKVRIAVNQGIHFSDDPSKNNVALTVEATDGKHSASTILNIIIQDINDNAPIFEKLSYVATINEDTVVGSNIIQLKANDYDSGLNAEVKYFFKKGAYNDFLIDEDNGIVTVASKLDYDRRNAYSIEVTAVDQGIVSLTGTATLSIQVLNVNNKIPYFTPKIQKAEVMENAEVGTLIHTLTAIDLDVNSSLALNFAATDPLTAVDKFGHSVDNDLFKEFFSLDNSNGKVIISHPLQRDVAATVTIPVLVTDITAPSVQQGKGTLIITITDVNDNPPKFLPPWTPEKPEYLLELQEELPVGTIIATFEAADDDSAIAGYYIKPENSYFEINNGTGILQIKTQLDYEQIKSLNFTIVAYDSGIPQLNASATIYVTIININDNSPVFSADKYNVVVKENSPNGTHIVTVKAIDLDEGDFGVVTYNLMGHYSENFIINPSTGEIFVGNAKFLDYEVLHEITIGVTATDQGSSNTKHKVSVPVIISVMDVNDNSPKFNQSIYNATVHENVRVNPPVPIVQVFATDADAGINGLVNYKILSGNENDVFILTPDTGILYAHRKFLNHNRNYRLEVEARDGSGNGKYSDQALINIEILNVNEHKPKIMWPSLFNFTVEFNQSSLPKNYAVARVKATDEDVGESGRLTYHFKNDGLYSQETSDFIINENSGTIETKRQLDYKKDNKYQLILVARDHGLPVWYEDVKPIGIYLRNSNYSGNVFMNTDGTNTYTFNVPENSKKNILVGQVKSTTSNGNNPSETFYHLLSRAKSKAFYIDKLDGTIYTNKVLDREEIAEYDLMVVATNEPDLYIDVEKEFNLLLNDSSYNDSIAKVKVIVMDVNDNKPKFVKYSYNAAINSKTPINTPFINISAEDYDLGINGSFEYYIRSSNLYKFGSNISSGSIIPAPFNVSQNGALSTAVSLTDNNQHRFIINVVAKEIVYPEQEGTVNVNVWIFEPDQLIRIILSRPMKEVLKEKDEIISELSNITNCIVVIHSIREHTKDDGTPDKDWTDMYILMVNPYTQVIVPIYDILKVIDSNYDFLKDYYAGFAIENVIPAYAVEEEVFDSELFALIVLVLVGIIGLITFALICCGLRRMISPSTLKKKDALISKAVINDLNTTENPLWIDQKLKIYEEQELSMQVFNEPEQIAVEQQNNREFIPDDNPYATIQHHGHQGTLSLSGDLGDYATLSHPSINSSFNNFEAAMGFQGSTFQVPESALNNLDSDEFHPYSMNLHHD